MKSKKIVTKVIRLHQMDQIKIMKAMETQILICQMREKIEMTWLKVNEKINKEK